MEEEVDGDSNTELQPTRCSSAEWHKHLGFIESFRSFAANDPQKLSYLEIVAFDDSG